MNDPDRGGGNAPTHAAPPAAPREASAAAGGGIRRTDLLLFGFYVILYAGFMGLTAFAPAAMATRVVGGVNLAIAYGMGLILAAVILAGVAMVLRHDPNDDRGGHS
jgi:hypothetical protein